MLLKVMVWILANSFSNNYLTITAGLNVINDTYVPSDVTGKIVGSGGIHIWDISSITKGEQKIEAVYIRSWEPLTGNETSFSMTVIVT